MQGKYLLYAHSNSRVFTLKQEGQDWQREFTSVFDAVSYAGTLPDSETATVTVFGTSGSQLAEVRVQDSVLAV